MNIDEFQQISPSPVLARVTAEDMMILGPDRTLLYGYTCERYTFHVYLEGGYIHRLVHSTTQVIECGAEEAWELTALVPDKRVYPESTDFGFAQMLRNHGVDVPYTRFDERRHLQVCSARFHGQRYDEMAWR